jgi:2-desacetyl-2-hydroxyethyl bacteriochlorophyllide A dehydrogenase
MYMKAVVYDKKHTPDSLVLQNVEKPSPGEGQVLVRIHAVSINAADYRSMRMGIVPKRKIFGADIAGRVEAVGVDTRTFKPGDRVFGDLSGSGFGGFAEYVAAPESALALIPETVSFDQAASIPMAALTALQAMRDKGNIRAGQKVLVYGAGGGVGTFAVQLAKYFGAAVTAVCGHKNVELVRTLGASRVIDYQTSDGLAGDQKYDLILGINGSRPLSEYRRSLAKDGIVVMVGGGLDQLIKFMLFGWLYSVGRKKMRLLAAKPSAKDLEFVVKLVEAGKITPIVDRSYPLEETAQAVRYASAGHAHGKVVLQVSGK